MVASIALSAFCGTGVLAAGAQRVDLGQIAAGQCVVDGKPVGTKALDAAIDIVNVVEQRGEGMSPAALGMLAINQETLERLANPNLNQETLRVYGDTVKEELKNNLPVIVKSEARIYTEHYSRAELEQLRSFYRSPLGRKVVAETIPITSETVELGLALTHSNIGAATAERARKKLRAQGVKI
jgi:hypothetical protein